MTTENSAAAAGRNYSIWPKVLLLMADLSLVLLIFAPLGARFGLWDWRLVLGNAQTYATAVGILLLIIVGGMVFATIKKQGTNRMWCSFALIVALIPMGVLLYQKDKVESVPFIHDITTDWTDPPRFVEVVALRGENSNPIDYSNPKVTEQQRAGYPDLKSLDSALSKQQAFARALELVDEYGWELVSENADEGRIEATETTFWFGFKDDVVLRIQEKGNGSLIDMRSVSRVGGSDLGANAARIFRFFEDFNQS